MKKILTICFVVYVCFFVQVHAQIPPPIAVQIVRSEDERRYDKTLEDLMKSTDEKIRLRAALAAGRIGDERAIPALTNLLENGSIELRAMAAFALGEIESIKAADAVLKHLQGVNTADPVRARLVEAAGKIAAANAKDPRAVEIGDAILEALESETRLPKQNRSIMLLGLTAVLRARPEEGDFVAAKFLTNMDWRVRADAANTLSRIRAKNANEQLRAMLLADDNAIVRANAARALGAAEDKDAFDLLLEAATEDEDSRVRVSAIRSLGSLKDKKAAEKLLQRGETLLAAYKKSKSKAPNEKNELLEIAAVLGRVLPKANSEQVVEPSALKFLDAFRAADKYQSPEIEVALARLAPDYLEYNFDPHGLMSDTNAKTLDRDWRLVSSLAQGFGELSKFDSTDAEKRVRKNAEGVLREPFEKETFLNTKVYAPALTMALPDVLRAFALYKSTDLGEILRKHLKHKDVFVRAAAAELLGEQPITKENAEALKDAFAKSLSTDKEYNDAQLAILSALVKLDKTQAISSLTLASNATDFLLRRQAAQLVKEDISMAEFQKVEPEFGTLKSYDPKSGTKLGQLLNSNVDYTRAVSRKSARAILTTGKGTFTIELLPEDAPLTVDNFIKLARANYFNGLAIHRVVPNFVMQDGDPRGDGNGGPGWQIRCELNMIEYERGAVGMALSGKDTGGSQWFVTHSPQPHLDGGYTVFGRVSETDMKIVDNLVRGDRILGVKIVEGNLPQKATKGRKK